MDRGKRGKQDVRRTDTGDSSTGAKMRDAERDKLETRREAIRQEISTLDESIIDIEAMGKAGQNSVNQLRTMKTARATRQRDLKDVEARLAKAT